MVLINVPSFTDIGQRPLVKVVCRDMRHETDIQQTIMALFSCSVTSAGSSLLVKSVVLGTETGRRPTTRQTCMTINSWRRWMLTHGSCEIDKRQSEMADWQQIAGLNGSHGPRVYPGAAFRRRTTSNFRGAIAIVFLRDFFDACTAILLNTLNDIHQSVNVVFLPLEIFSAALSVKCEQTDGQTEANEKYRNTRYIITNYPKCVTIARMREKW